MIAGDVRSPSIARRHFLTLRGVRLVTGIGDGFGPGPDLGDEAGDHGGPDDTVRLASSSMPTACAASQGS